MGDIAAELRNVRREALAEAVALCDVCGRPTGGCCAVMIGPATHAVDRYRGYIRQLMQTEAQRGLESLADGRIVMAAAAETEMHEHDSMDRAAAAKKG